MRRISGENGEQEADLEHGVGWSTVEIDARQHRVKATEDGRVPAERVDHHHGGGGGEEADLTRP